VAALEDLDAFADSEAIHADQAILLLRLPNVPHLRLNLRDLFFCASATHLPCVFSEFHQLFVRHPVHIGIVRVAALRVFVFGLFNRSLQQSVLFSLGLLLMTTAPTKCHHEHLSLINARLNLAHVESHLQMSHHVGIHLIVVSAICPIASSCSFSCGCQIISRLLDHLSPDILGCSSVLFFRCLVRQPFLECDDLTL